MCRIVDRGARQPPLAQSQQVSPYALLIDLDEGFALKHIPVIRVNRKKFAKIERDDVVPKIDYRVNAILCCAISANPSLVVIEGFVRIPIKTDRYTKEKTMLNFARMLIEVLIEGPFLKVVEFINDFGVKFQWKPILCGYYHLYDHETDANMEKLGMRQEWRVVNKEKKVEVEREDVNNPEQEVGDKFINVFRRTSKAPMSQPQTPIVDEVSAIGVTRPMETKAEKENE
ncbi:hypothetical protein Cgig2_010252 [Carnegiea gigantea]|uniref:Uncharacterized protein n=1 Tax=Carnegiea gigantea TaxID=171969 RepID=A0A9Q1GSP1_9CARY|nr:hypothetical protein Cgig2_010252 [Carnegiea gigantea]